MITAMPRIALAVHDVDAALELFGDGLGLPVTDLSAQTAPSLGARIAMCQPEGGSNIELMSPADPAKPLSQALARFLDRRGEGIYAVMLEAPDPDAEAVELAARGLDVLPLMPGAGGRDVHPRSTHGVLVRVYPDHSVAQPARPARGVGGLGGIVRATVATDDAVLAADAWGRGFGLAVDAPLDDAERGVRVVTCHPPRGGVIDLVSVVDGARPFASSVRRFLDERGEGVHSLTLGADDPARATAYLAEPVFGARFAVSG
jgi:methylmalonyl-CoA/ethylmalonyl-CoA epimerase